MAIEHARLAGEIDAVWVEIWERAGAPAGSSARPTVTAMMVCSVDGRVTEGGRVAALTGPADQAILHRLRVEHDAVMVGATTVRVEGYASLLTSAERAKRQAAGRSAQPLLCIVSAQPTLDPELAPLRAGDLSVLVLTTSSFERSSLPASVGVIGADADAAGELDMAALLGRLRGERQVRSVLCEGGPTLLGSLVRAQLLDQLILVLSPRIAGGDGLRAMANSGVTARELELTAHAAAGGFAFLRYRFGS